MRDHRDAQQRYHSQQPLLKNKGEEPNPWSILQTGVSVARPRSQKLQAQSSRLLVVDLFPAGEGSPQWKYTDKSLGVHHPYRFWIFPVQCARQRRGAREEVSVQVDIGVYLSHRGAEFLRILLIPSIVL